MLFVQHTSRLAWLIFLFFCPLLLFKSHLNAHQIGLSGTILITYSAFLTLILSRKNTSHQTRHFYRWLSKPENIQQFTLGCMLTLKSTLKDSAPIVIASILILPYIFSVEAWIDFIRALVSFSWLYSLMVNTKSAYYASYEKPKSSRHKK